MNRVEIITGVERRRRYSDEERAAVLAMCDEPKATIVGVAKRLGMSPGLIHGWRRMRREAEKLSSEPLQFIDYGSVAEPTGQAFVPTPMAPQPVPVQNSAAEELARPHPGTRPGAIDIDLPSGIRLSVDIERQIADVPAEQRQQARAVSKAKALDFFAWADDVLSKVSARSPLAEALRYAVKLKPQLLTYTEDGRLEIDNNPAENALRGICLGRKNWLFAGADCGGERAAAMYSLLETAKLNGVNPQEWLADVLDRIGKGHPINRIDDLLPWKWHVSNISGQV